MNEIVLAMRVSSTLNEYIHMGEGLHQNNRSDLAKVIIEQQVIDECNYIDLCMRALRKEIIVIHNRRINHLLYL